MTHTSGRLVVSLLAGIFATGLMAASGPPIDLPGTTWYCDGRGTLKLKIAKGSKGPMDGRLKFAG